MQLALPRCAVSRRGRRSSPALALSWLLIFAPFGARANDAAPARDESALTGDVFDGAGSLARAALVRAVEARSPTLAAARDAVRAAEARPAQEGALDDPMLEYALGPRSFGSPMVRDAHMVELSQKIPFPGRRGLREDAALAEASAMGFDAESTRLRLSVLACSLYDEAWSTDRALEINAAHRTLVDEIHRLELSRYAAGAGERDAVLESELEAAELDHQRVELEAMGARLRARINAMLHRLPAAPLPPLPARLALPVDPGEPAQLVERALAARPELRAASARVSAGEKSVSAAKRDRFPDVELYGRWDGFWQERPLQPVVGMRIELPLQVGRRNAAVAEADADLSRARHEVARIEDETRLAIEQAHLASHEAEHLVKIFDERTLPAARDRMETARAQWAAGMTPLATLLQAERALRRAELGRAEALATWLRRRAELARATGDLSLIDQEIGR